MYENEVQPDELNVLSGLFSYFYCVSRRRSVLNIVVFMRVVA